MALSKVGIWNMGLSHLGIGKAVANENEQSAEATACRVWWETALDITLRSWRWPFARKTKALGLVEENPNSEWGFSYRYPADCVDARRIVNGMRVETIENRIPFQIEGDEAGSLILCDQQDAELEYTRRVTEANFFPQDFALALSAQLAVLMAPKVTPLKSGYGKEAAQKFAFYIAQAKANAYNEQVMDKAPEAESIRARDGGESSDDYWRNR